MDRERFRGGIFISTDESFQVGDDVRVGLSFPGLLKPVDIKAKVTWLREASVGQRADIGVEVQSDAQRRRLAQLAFSCVTAKKDPPESAYRLLIADDDESITRMYRRSILHAVGLADSKLDIVIAGNGKEALAVIEKEPLDLVITDLYMPVMDGFGFIEKLRAREQAANVPALTSTPGDSGSGLAFILMPRRSSPHITSCQTIPGSNRHFVTS